MKKVCSLLLVLFLITAITKIYAQGTWHNLDGGVSCNGSCGNTPVGVYAICPDTIHNVLYVGGIFNRAGNNIVQYGLSKWDGTQWDTLPLYLGGGSPMIMYQDTLYVGNFGKYDGNKFYALPSFNDVVNCFAIYKDTLYAGGAFTKSGSTSVNGIAKWNGKAWIPLGLGIYGSCCPVVNAMAVYNDTLIVGGYFTNAGALSVNSIVKWDGSNWSNLGTGIKDANNPGFVFSMDTFKKKLYVGGEFDAAGGVTSYSLASWNGKNWDSLASQPSTYQYALKSFNGYLFMSGLIGTNDVENIAKYDGNIISTVDSDVNHLIYSLGIWNGSLYVGGEFDTAGKTVPANYIARWTPDTPTGIKQTAKDDEQVSAYPNPTSNQLTFNSSQAIEQLQIEDVLGQVLSQQTFNAPIKKQTMNVSTLPAGIYFYKLTTTPAQVLSGKFIKE